MWRYYELVTDVSMAAVDIEQMKRDVGGGAAHPMKLKQELGKRIIADFHSREAAEQAAQCTTGRACFRRMRCRKICR